MRPLGAIATEGREAAGGPDVWTPLCYGCTVSGSRGTGFCLHGRRNTKRRRGGESYLGAIEKDRHFVVIIAWTIKHRKMYCVSVFRSVCLCVHVCLCIS